MLNDGKCSFCVLALFDTFDLFDHLGKVLTLLPFLCKCCGGLGIFAQQFFVIAQAPTIDTVCFDRFHNSAAWL